MVRPKKKNKTNRRKKPDRQPTMIGAAGLGLALLIMVAIVGAVYWLNPKDDDAGINGSSVSHIGPIFNSGESTGISSSR
jgi:hypothetical protein